MNDREWDIVKKCAACEPMDKVPAGMIVDSPWIPGYVGVSTLDYYTDMNVFLNANAKIKADFPGMIYIPDYWVEFGMAAEPSGHGCKPNFYDYQPVMISHIAHSADDIEELCKVSVPDPHKDGLMPLAINYYKNIKKPLHEKGEKIRIVASRGPLNICTHMMGIMEFLMAYKMYPDEAHKLIKKNTELVKRWLTAQMEALDYVEGILVLDDIVGFMSEEDYEEFAHPYFKEIYDTFNVPVKAFHNDNHNPVSFPYMADVGINIFNFSHQMNIAEARKLLGDKVCILGNVPPLDTLTQGTPEDSYAKTIECLNTYGSKQGLILSAGGGCSPGTPKANLDAMLKALSDWNSKN